MAEDDDKAKTTRRIFLGGLAAAGGYVVASELSDDGGDELLGAVGDTDNEVQIMPGQIKQQYYYPTIEEFENNEGEPNQFPALVLTDEGAWMYDE